MNIRLLILLVFVAGSLLLIGPNPSPSGIVVNYVTKDTGIVVGEIIYKINDADATPDMLDRDYYGIVTLQTNRGEKFINANGSLGMSAEYVPSTNLQFGLDIKGGVRALIEPNTTENATISHIISTLQTRINIYGLRESSFRPIFHQDRGFIEISMAGGNIEELRDLLERQGKFEAKIPLLLDANTTLKLDKDYELVTGNNSLSIPSEGISVSTGESFVLAGILFDVGDIDNKINMTSTVFDSGDIVAVFFGPQSSRIEPAEDGYRWSFGIQISSDGAEKFAWITQNIPRRLNYLESQIYLYLDNKLIDSLNIAASLKGRAETQIVIEGGAQTKDVATQEMSKLQSILRSGALPTNIEIVQIDEISPKLGIGFLTNAAFAGLAAVAGVVFIVLLRYRRIGIVFPMVLISLSEVIIILGASVGFGWTIDLAAIAGIIVAVGTGIDSQIIILDHALRKELREETLKEKLEKAFFIIFGAGGVIIAAMFPLLILGFGFLRGFAIITITGVLIRLLITRPAFGALVGKIVKE